MKKPNKTTKSVNQSGFVSIVVCLIIMVILTLVTIGFSKLMGRAQRQALDRQLSTQAFYAAESGVNDALLAYKSNPASISKLCSPVKNILDESVSSTCVFSDGNPTSVEYDKVGTNPVVIPIHTYDSSGARALPNNITITWSPDGGGSASTPVPSGYPKVFPSYSGWNASKPIGVAKVGIIPFKDFAGGRGETINNYGSFEAYPYATSGAGDIAYIATTGTSFGSTVNAKCEPAPAQAQCSVSVNTSLGLTPPSFGGDLYLSLSSIYKNSKFVVTATGADSRPMTFADVQLVVDSTGKSTDVLRRIRVRKPLSNNKYTYPDSALKSTGPGGICKLITASPSGVNNDLTACP
jgi:Tfp pilus assembly protein PilX